MSTLFKLQQTFSRALFTDSVDEIVPYLQGEGVSNIEHRFDVYRQNIRTALTGTLKEIFSTCQLLVGQRYFEQLAWSYIKTHPSRSQDINQFGQAFPEHLAEVVQQRIEARHLLYLPDVARLEWLIRNSQVSPIDPPFDFQGLAAVPEGARGRIIFRLSDAAFLFSSSFPVYEIWKRHQQEQFEQALDCDNKKDYLLIFREQFKPCVFQLNEALWTLLSRIAQGNTLEQITEDPGVANLNIEQEMMRATQLGWITGFQVSPNFSQL